MEENLVSALEEIGRNVNAKTSPSGVAGISGGLISAFEGQLLASAGKAVRSKHFLQAGSGAPCYIACISAGLLFINEVFVKVMISQEIYIHTAVRDDVVQVKGGSCFPVYRRNNNAPFEANNPSQAGKEFFYNHFRSSPSPDFISPLLPIATSVQIYGPNPAFVDGVIAEAPQHDIVIPAGETATPLIVGIGEFYVKSDYEILISTGTNNAVYDQRTVPPPARRLIGCIRSGGGNNLSSLRSGNTVEARLRNGAIGTFVASPGSPDKLDIAANYNTSSVPSNTDFFRDSIAILSGQNGEINAYAGADTAGLNAVQFVDVNTAANVFVLPLDVNVRNSDNDRGVFMSLYECEAYVFDPDGSYRGRVDLRRGSGNGTASPATTVEHQTFPSAENVRPNLGIFAGQGTMPRGTKIVFNMPSFVIMNFGQGADNMATDDETMVFGDTDERLLCETRIDPISGVLERNRRNVANTAYEWVAA